MVVANTLAYFVTVRVTAVKMFIVKALGDVLHQAAWGAALVSSVCMTLSNTLHGTQNGGVRLGVRHAHLGACTNALNYFYETSLLLHV
jgi:hypothetical protein